jgi:cell division protein FtsI (penicillin-binding protein 3)
MMYGLKNDIENVENIFKIRSLDSASTDPSPWREVTMHAGIASLSNLSDKIGAGHTVPDVKDLGLKDAVFLLENMGLRVSATGRGKVTSQSISPNAGFNKGQTIKLELN